MKPWGFTYEEMQMFHPISDSLGIQKSNPYCAVWILNPSCVRCPVNQNQPWEGSVSMYEYFMTCHNEWKSWLSQRDRFSFHHRSHWHSFPVPFSKCVSFFLTVTVTHLLLISLHRKKRKAEARWPLYEETVKDVIYISATHSNGFITTFNLSLISVIHF